MDATPGRAALVACWLALLIGLPAGLARAQGAVPVEIEFWQGIRETRDEKLLEAYLRSYPSGTFAKLARDRMASLAAAKASPKAVKGAASGPRRTGPALYQQLNLFGDILARLRADSVDVPDDRQLIKAAVDGIAAAYPDLKAHPVVARAVSRLDVATTTLSQALQEFGDVYDLALSAHPDAQFADVMFAAIEPMAATVGAEYKPPAPKETIESAAIGAEYKLENGVPVYKGPSSPDTPAARSELKPGDLIRYIGVKPKPDASFDFVSTAGWRLEKVVERVRGPANTPIMLVVEREGQGKFLYVVKIVREIVRGVQAITVQMQGKDVLHVKLTRLDKGTKEQVRKSVEDLKRSAGAALKGVVVDLRQNTGGLLDEAIAVADLFLERGTIALTAGRSAEETQRAMARPGDIADGKRIAVLIDGTTAAGAEMIAVALHQNDRATLIGTRSFGMAKIHTHTPLGQLGLVSVLTARMLDATGKSWDNVGLTPDQVVERPGQADTQLDAALAFVRGKG